jgi:phage terminase large subunit-like protein
MLTPSICFSRWTSTILFFAVLFSLDASASRRSPEFEFAERLDRDSASKVADAWEPGFRRPTYKIPGEDGSFVRYRIKGDGNCALHCIDRSRPEFLQHLIHRANESSEIAKKLDAEIGVFSFEKYNTYKKDVSEEERLNHILTEMSLDSQHLSYNQSPQAGTLGLAAHTFELNLDVFTLLPDGSTLKKEVAYRFGKGGEPIFNLLHTENSAGSRLANHFERLVREDDLAMRDHARNKESEWAIEAVEKERTNALYIAQLLEEDQENEIRAQLELKNSQAELKQKAAEQQVEIDERLAQQQNEKALREAQERLHQVARDAELAYREHQKNLREAAQRTKEAAEQMALDEALAARLQLEAEHE